MASDGRQGAWVGIAVALIAGGATVLAATLPLYLRTNRELQRTTATSDSETAALQRRVDDLLAAVKEKDAEIAKLTGRQHLPSTPLPGPTSTEYMDSSAPPSPQGPIRIVVSQEFRFAFQSCALSAATLKCGFLATNLAGDRKISIDSGRIIDANGNEYEVSQFYLGAERGPFHVWSTLPADTPVKGSLEFKSFRPGTKLLKIFELNAHTLDGPYNQIAVRFTDITL